MVDPPPRSSGSVKVSTAYAATEAPVTGMETVSDPARTITASGTTTLAGSEEVTAIEASSSGASDR